MMPYYLGTQKLRFSAPLPEQIGTTTMHFFKHCRGPNLLCKAWVQLTNLTFKACTDLRCKFWCHLAENEAARAASVKPKCYGYTTMTCYLNCQYVTDSGQFYGDSTAHQLHTL